MKKMKKMLFAAAAAALVLIGTASAQDFPSRPITMVIPFAAGGPQDTIGRIFAQRMSELLGQQVVVENVGGAGGMTGSKRVADAKPDGYTMILGSVGTHTDFAPVKGTEAPGFMSAANDQVLAIAQIESGEAVEAIQGIAAVDGIDALLIGPNDLAVSLGYTGDVENPAVIAAIDKVAEAARRHGKIFGIHGPDPLMERYLSKDLRLIMSKLDINVLLGAMGEIAAKWKKG